MLIGSNKARRGDHRSGRPAWAAALMVLLLTPTMAAAQEPKEAPAGNSEPMPMKTVRGRLPAHFSRVVSSEQRTTIYRLQANYAEQIAELKRQIEKLTKERDDEVEAVLTADQRRQVARFREAARVAREERAAEKAKAKAAANAGAENANAEKANESKPESGDSGG